MLKQLFPIIERYRSDFIRLHFHEIEALLPISNRLGEDLSTPQDSLCDGLSLQVFVLYLQKSAAPGRTDIQQAPQKLTLGVCVCRNAHIPIVHVNVLPYRQQQQHRGILCTKRVDAF